MDQPVVAGILAGGRWKGTLPDGIAPWRALFPLNGAPMAQYVLDAVAPLVVDTFFIGPPELAGPFSGTERLEAGDSLTDNVVRACRYAAGRGLLLLAACDMPLITAPAVDDFITRCRVLKRQAYYSVVSERVMTSSFPAMRRTYVRLKDGTFTGGNLLLLDPEATLAHEPIIQELYDSRKKPLALASRLGPELLIRAALTHALRLPLLDVDLAGRLISRRLGCTVAGVPTPHAEVGADLDSIAEAPLYSRLLEERSATVVANGDSGAPSQNPSAGLNF
jgi:molybdopterin-guanine dinucleotide biosynthesis protein A